MAVKFTDPTVRKTDIVRSHVRRGEWVQALSIAKGFRMLTRDDKRDIVRAHEAVHFPDFARQIGKDPSTLVMTGVGVLRRLYA